MKRFALILWALLCLPTIANAQGRTGLWYLNVNNGQTIAGTVNPFPVTCISGCSGGGGGGAITIASGAVASGAYSSGSIALGAYASGSIASGAMVDLGTQADSACGTATGTCTLISLVKFLNTGVTSAIPAGTATIGNVNGAPNVTPHGCSGAMVAGGTAQDAFAAGATKHGFTIQNLSTDSMTISFTGTAGVPGTADSYTLNPSASGVAGGSYSTPFGFGMNTALSVLAERTSSTFSCTWW